MLALRERANRDSLGEPYKHVRPLSEVPPPPVPQEPVSTLMTHEQCAAAASDPNLKWISVSQVSQRLVPVVASWEGPTPQAATAVPFDIDESQLDWHTLPAQAGENPGFDAAFDQLVDQGKSISYERTANDLLAAILESS